MRTKVAIVKAGEWGILSQAEGDYDYLVERLTDTVDQATTGSGPDASKAAESRVVGSTKEALSWLGRRGVIVFVSRGMCREAQQVASEYPGIRVVLFTGLVPEGEVIFISKGWGLDHEQVERVLFYG